MIFHPMHFSTMKFNLLSIFKERHDTGVLYSNKYSVMRVVEDDGDQKEGAQKLPQIMPRLTATLLDFKGTGFPQIWIQPSSEIEN